MSEASTREPAIRVVLVRTQGPINLGLCARVCANLGVDELRLVNPLAEIDSPDSRKFANHAKDALLRAPLFDSVGEAVADCEAVVATSANRRQRGYCDPLVPEDISSRFRGVSSLALVFGNEAHGLDNDELRSCQSTLTLPTWGDYTSYNLSHAVAVATYTVRANFSRPLARGYGPEASMPGALQGEIDELSEVWLAVLDRFGYFRRTHLERFAPKLQAMLGRLRLARHDVGLLRGMLAQFDLHAPDPARLGKPGSDSGTD